MHATFMLPAVDLLRMNCGAMSVSFSCTDLDCCLSKQYLLIVADICGRHGRAAKAGP